MTELIPCVIGALVVGALSYFWLRGRHAHVWSKWRATHVPAYYENGISIEVTRQRRYCQECGLIQIKRVER